MKRPTILSKSIALSLGLSVAASAMAQTNLTWDIGGPNDNWSTSAGNTNWYSDGSGTGTLLWSQDSNAIFSEATAGETIAVTTNNSFNNILFGAANYTIGSSGAGNLDIDSTDNASSITVDTGISATIQEVIRNNGGGVTAGSLEKLGAGTLILSNGNSFTGGLTIGAGTVTSTNAAGFGTGTVTVNSGGDAIINVGNTTVANAFSGAGCTTSAGEWMGRSRRTISRSSPIASANCSAPIDRTRPSSASWPTARAAT